MSALKKAHYSLKVIHQGNVVFERVASGDASNIVLRLPLLMPIRGHISDSFAINIANKKGIKTAFTNDFLNLGLLKP